MDNLSLPIPKLGKEVVDKKTEMNLVDRLFGKTYREQQIHSPRGKPATTSPTAPPMSPRLTSKAKTAINLKSNGTEATAKKKSNLDIDNMVARLFGRKYKEQQLMSPRKRDSAETLKSGWRVSGGNFQSPASPRAREIEVAREEVRKEQRVKRLRRKKKPQKQSNPARAKPLPGIEISKPNNEEPTVVIMSEKKPAVIASIPTLAIPKLVDIPDPSERPDACSDCESSVASSSSTSGSDYLWETDSGSDFDDDYEYQYQSY
eukprot:TRINITY_DN5439_c0_g1_i1.p1 TRINITY_DN5439_c0_g1~~TRINITY_DN5439_c0_g1_i1.p1  ORF type:complete len:261 (+),score=65.09 TRINITY_DN5439_c0_g1_i1:62-844(+)